MLLLLYLVCSTALTTLFLLNYKRLTNKELEPDAIIECTVFFFCWPAILFAISLMAIPIGLLWTVLKYVKKQKRKLTDIEHIADVISDIPVIKFPERDNRY